MLLADTETVVDRPSNSMKPPDEDNEADVVQHESIEDPLILRLVTMFESPVIIPKPPLETAWQPDMIELLMFRIGLILELVSVAQMNPPS